MIGRNNAQRAKQARGTEREEQMARSIVTPRRDQQEQRMPLTGCWGEPAFSLWRLRQHQGARLTRVSSFLLVGGSGVLVNSVALFLLFQRAHLPLLVASALSAELAIVNNFYWNNRWTFRRPRLSWRRFAQFNLVSLAGLLISTCTLGVLVRYLGLYYLAANLLGIALATAWNFAANSFWTWGGAR